jgi:hypothetical protein
MQIKALGYIHVIKKIGNEDSNQIQKVHHNICTSLYESWLPNFLERVQSKFHILGSSLIGPG